MEDISFNGKILHTEYPRPDAYGALNMPVYHAAAYEFDTAEQMELAFTGKTADHAYSRITNPSVQHFEDRVKAITGAYSVTALNSGMAAITNAVLAVGYAGANIVTSRHLFGNTYSFFASTISAYGVEIRFCDLTDEKAVEEQMDENTCCVFLEIITNPQLEVVDLKALSAIARKKNVPVIADTTIIPFCAFRAQDWGIDIEVVSSTKYISGGATSLGGLIVDYATFDWSKSRKLNQLSTTEGFGAFTFTLRREIHRNLGAYMTPHVAYMQTLGLETLSLRYTAASGNCLRLAQQLQTVPEIESVNYTGLSENSHYSLSKTQFGDAPGAMFTIDLASREVCFSFLNRLKKIKRATNLFDNKSLAIHPASTIYGNFKPELRQILNVSDKTIRFSVGLENVEDLYNDIVQALKG